MRALSNENAGHRFAGMRRLGLALALAGSVGAVAADRPAIAQSAQQTCTEAQIATATDTGNARLRQLNAATGPRIDVKLRELQRVKGWSDHDLDEQAYAQLEDDRIRTFDRETNALVTRLETLGEARAPGGTPPCERLVEVRQTLERLAEIGQQKSDYMIAKLERELQAASSAPTTSAGQRAPASASLPPPAPSVGRVTIEGQPPKGQEKAQEQASSWSTTASKAPPPAAPPAAPSPVPAVAPPRPISLPPPEAVATAYTREEIAAAGEGFFGKISTGLAGVIDYAFQQAGRPTGYILGDEGGGAFLAGLRYGKGLLHLKGQPPQEIFWRGPSIGYDIGAAGSRLMVLVYNVHSPEDLYANFAGLDGSAYLVGGVGLTFLTNGKKVMAPIRSGIGLRLGASLGYLKFSPKPSWNPF